MINFLLAVILPLSVSGINFLAVGDWGGKERSPYYTEAQADSAKGMDLIASQLNADFVLALGDNIYYNGVIDEHDERFKSTFENVYSAPSLQKPWYMVAGNHDYRGNITGEVEYTPYSSRWIFPSLYYTKSFTGSDGTTLDLIVIDTIELASMSDKQIHEEGYFDPLPLMTKEHASSQWDWIEQQMAASTANYLLVAGHYPVYSVCEHGPTQTLIDHLLPLLKQYNAHYLNGHDHCMEHIVEKGSSVNHFLSGMGMFCCYRSKNKKAIPAGSLKWYQAADNKEGNTAGFTSFEVKRDGMVVKYYNQDGTVLYTAPTVAPRS